VNIILPRPVPRHAMVEMQDGEGLALDRQTDLIVAAVAVAVAVVVVVVVVVLAVVAHHQLSGAAVQYMVNMKATILVAVMVSVVVVAEAVVGDSGVEEDPPAAAGIVAEPRPDFPMARAKPSVMSLLLRYLSFLSMSSLTPQSGRIISKCLAEPCLWVV